jgi:hypothetical protein
MLVWKGRLGKPSRKQHDNIIMGFIEIVCECIEWINWLGMGAARLCVHRPLDFPKVYYFLMSREAISRNTLYHGVTCEWPLSFWWIDINIWFRIGCLWDMYRSCRKLLDFQLTPAAATQHLKGGLRSKIAKVPPSLEDSNRMAIRMCTLHRLTIKV